MNHPAPTGLDYGGGDDVHIIKEDEKAREGLANTYYVNRYLVF